MTNRFKNLKNKPKTKKRTNNPKLFKKQKHNKIANLDV